MDYELLKQIDNLGGKLEVIDFRLSQKEIAHDDLFNEVIENVVLIIKRIKSINNVNMLFYIERIADYVVEIIEIINNGLQNNIRTYISNILMVFSYLRSFIVSENKKNIIVLGISEYTKYLDEIIDFNKSNLLAYVNVNNSYIDVDFFKTKFFIRKEEMDQMEVDYYIVMDELPSNIHVDSSKTINYSEYLKLIYFQSPEFSVQISDFLMDKKDYDGIITGISYTKSAIDMSILKHNFVSLANPSQDLYYDFEMFKYALERSNHKDNIKHCIIGLCSYSFDYDLSLSEKNQHRSLYYYPLINSMHHYKYRDIYTS